MVKHKRIDTVKFGCSVRLGSNYDSQVNVARAEKSGLTFTAKDDGLHVQWKASAPDKEDFLTVVPYSLCSITYVVERQERAEEPAKK